MKISNILIISGEPSGDLHASNLIKNLLVISPEIKIDVVGGKYCKEIISLHKNINLIYDIEKLSFMGFIEILKNLKVIKSFRNFIFNQIKSNNYDKVVLIDYPGLNLKIAQYCYASKINVSYYICPQIWAWHYSRIHKIIKYCKQILVIFNFEKDLYSKEGGNVFFTGHPILDVLHNYKIKNEVSKKTIALIPGSRSQEIKKILPKMIEIVRLSKDKLKDYNFTVSFMNESLEKEYASLLPDYIDYFTGNYYELLDKAYFSLTTSGTATLETALFGVPMFVLYKVNVLSAIIAKVLVKIPHLSLVNIVAKKKIVEEYMQWNLKPEIISKEMINILNDNNKYNQIKNELLKFNDLLRNDNNDSPSKCAANIIFNNYYKK